MKKLQKLIGIIVVIMLMSVQLIPIINVSAEDSESVTIITEENTNLITNTSIITVSNLANDEELFTVYKTLDAFYNSTTNEITYDFTSDFSTFLEQDDEYKDLTVEEYLSIGSGSIISGDVSGDSGDLSRMYGNYATYIRNNDISGLDMSTSGNSATIETEVGSYLILPRSNKYVYGVMVGNVEIYADNNTWKIRGTSIVAKYDDLYVETYITDKLGNSLEDYLNMMDSFVSDKSFLIGQEYTNYIETDIDYPYNAINELYKIEITFDDGITFLGIDTLSIVNGIGYKFATISDGILYLEGVEAGTILVEDKKIVVEVDLNKWSPSSVVIAFRTKLNSDAVIGGVGNMMTTKLYYAGDPFDLNSVSVVESVNTSYTYGLNIGNYGDEAKTVKLSGGVFEIYSDSDLSTKVGEVSITDGAGSLVGIADGTYYLKQKIATSGYKLLNDIMEFEVNSNSDYTTIDIVNAEMGFLPSTGGIGTILYTLIGLTVILIASVSVIYYRKRVNN